MPPRGTITLVTTVGEMLISVEWLHVPTLLICQPHN